KSEGLEKSFNEHGTGSRSPGCGLAMTPYRTRPRRIALVAGNDVEMELAHIVAKGADIDLEALLRCLDRLRRNCGLEGQHGLVERRHVEHLRNAAALRHQEHPGPACILHQPELAQSQLHQQ